MVTNRLNKISGFQSGESSFSDHTLQSLFRSTKDIMTQQKFICIRSLNFFDKSQYQHNGLNHEKHVETFYENDPDANIQLIIHDSLNKMAPVKTIQMGTKNALKISMEAKVALAERDVALHVFKQSNLQDDLRSYKHIKNRANFIINREKYKRKVNLLQDEGSSSAEKWRRLKQETGQSKFTSPQIIVEKSNHYTSHKSMADSLNRQYVRRVSKLVEEMPPPCRPLNRI